VLEAVHANPPDLIILDLWMSVMNGWQFLGRLRELGGRLSSIPIIAVSADVNAHSDDMPVEIFLTKPMEIDRLLAAVRENLQTA
jgi:CheY-like chemotaxis protein